MEGFMSRLIKNMKAGSVTTLVRELRELGSDPAVPSMLYLCLDQMDRIEESWKRGDLGAALAEASIKTAPPEINLLKQLSGNRDPKIRCAVIAAILQIDPVPGVVTILKDLSQDRDIKVRQRALRGLERIGS